MKPIALSRDSRGQNDPHGRSRPLRGYFMPSKAKVGLPSILKRPNRRAKDMVPFDFFAFSLNHFNGSPIM